MSDRKLLEDAAKAAGYEVRWRESIGGFYFGLGSYTPQYWNPLTDDGDALRLAAKLGLTVAIDLTEGCTRIMNEYEGTILRHMHFDGGVERATRHAITRAAAAIGAQHSQAGEG